MKTVLNRIRKLNISNSVIKASTGFDKVQLKAFLKDPSEYPIMRNKLIKFYKSHIADKHKRVQLNMVPVSHENVSTKHHMIPVKENAWSKGKAALKRLYRGLRGI